MKKKLNLQLLLQSSDISIGILNVKVQVTNSGSAILVGSIHITSTATNSIKNANNMTFPAGQTIIKVFEFSQNQIPAGTSFRVEVI
jgi:hypothetical protein